MAVQLARQAGAHVIGTGRNADRDRALKLGADTFLELRSERLERVGEVDVIGDEVLAK
ncbi:hypothetical protein [Amycolatopsis sp. FDAARGOS 1241]|uniref:hypothetical protein n=1 Tax=Amycolatopsis sp. FDAARGOS 1241 TaxID=2778070 RepID=UPI001951BCF0|nr:hypothetical protein [Amycolatopsis sp. FDAARGOS 1241]QRP50958.1 hypothetical protein I6J71_24740 [Amycolatopsis sp. FDAARGOS 1241]